MLCDNDMKPNKLLYFMLAASMFLVATIDHTRGPLIPQFRVAFDMNASQIGLLFSFTSLLYVSGVYLVGKIISKVSYKPNLIFGLCSAILAFLVIYNFQNKSAFIVGMALSTFATAQLSILVNLCVPKLDIKNHTIIINLMHFMYGFSATITQKTMGWSLGMGMQYTQIYFYMSLLFLVFLPIAFFVKFEQSKNSPLELHEHDDDRLPTLGADSDIDSFAGMGEQCREKPPVDVKYKEEVQKKLENYNPRTEIRLTVAFIFIMGMYIAGEAQTATWLYTYIVDVFQKSPGEATNFTSIFFMSLTFGRLFGGFAVEKIGHMKSVLILFCIASGLYFLGLLFGDVGLFLIAISGLFFSVIYPTLVLSYSKYFKDSIKSSSIIISGASAVNMVINSVMGVLNDNIGIGYSMYFIPLCMGVAIVLMLMIKKKHGFKI